LAILPRGFDSATAFSDLADVSEAATIRKVLAEDGITLDALIPRDQSVPIAIQKSADWIFPTFFVGSMLLTQSPQTIDFAIGVLQSYVAQFLPRSFRKPSVRLEFVVEVTKDKTFKKLTYTGDGSGLKDLSNAIRHLTDE
jgi:hypothetical protein